MPEIRLVRRISLAGRLGSESDTEPTHPPKVLTTHFTNSDVNDLTRGDFPEIPMPGMSDSRLWEYTYSVEVAARWKDGWNHVKTLDPDPHPDPPTTIGDAPTPTLAEELERAVPTPSPGDPTS